MVKFHFLGFNRIQLIKKSENCATSIQRTFSKKNVQDIAFHKYILSFSKQDYFFSPKTFVTFLFQKLFWFRRVKCIQELKNHLHWSSQNKDMEKETSIPQRESCFNFLVCAQFKDLGDSLCINFSDRL